MKKERLIEYAMMSAIYIATTVMALHPEVQANEQPVETHPATVMPENLPERYRASRFLKHQPEQIPVTRLASVGNMIPVTIQPEPLAVPQRLPSTYEEAQEFIQETIRITGQVYTPEEVAKVLQNFSPLVQCAVRAETNSLNPYAIGAELELGPGQLHRFGKLPTFYKKYTNPFDPDQVFPFIEEQVALGDGNHWAGIRDGICYTEGG